MSKELCDKDCNNCPVIGHPNSRLLTKIFNEAQDKFGDEFYDIVQSNCPNMTVCYDCRVDDFCHVEGCELMSVCAGCKEEDCTFRDDSGIKDK